MKPRSWKGFEGWSAISILFSVFLLAGCADSAFDITSATDREAMKIEIRSALTRSDCGLAVDLSSRLYDSEYSDNDIRMLHASALGCKAGINLYDAIDELTSFGGGNPIGQFARIFPSILTDQKLESAWVAQDALQAILKPGTVVGSGDQVLFDTRNPGSVLYTDRTDDSNAYAFFVSMAIIGGSLNRFGNPNVGGGYSQGTDLTWTTRAAVVADTSGTACGLAAGFLNYFDSFAAIQSSLPSGSSGAISTMLTLIQGPIVDGISGNPLHPCNNIGGMEYCKTQATAAECALAKTRLRYRASCSETPAIGHFAAGMIQCINALWL